MRHLDATRPQTRQRRQLQPLWNALDEVLLPRMGEGVLLAVSGGPDSRALLESAARWRGRLAGSLEVAAVDHRVRPEAREEVDAVVARARALGFAAVALPIAPDAGSDEASLRVARYGVLRAHAACRGLAAIATAHHADDDAEGYLLHLLGWGGGPGGAAMSPSSDRGDLWVLRPFLSLGRAELALALSALGIADVLRDPHDARALGQRARVRHRLLPRLRSLRPGVTRRLSVISQRAREDEFALRALAMQWLEADGQGAFVPRQTLPERALARRALEMAIARLAPADPRAGARTVEALLDAGGWGATAPRLGRRFDLPGGRAEVVSGGVRVVPAHASRHHGRQRAADPPGPGCPTRNGDA